MSCPSDGVGKYGYKWRNDYTYFVFIYKRIDMTSSERERERETGRWKSAVFDPIFSSLRLWFYIQGPTKYFFGGIDQIPSQRVTTAPSQRHAQSELLLWLPGSPVGLKLCAYMIFKTLERFPPSFQFTWFVPAVPLFTQVEYPV